MTTVVKVLVEVDLDEMVVVPEMSTSSDSDRNKLAMVVKLLLDVFTELAMISASSWAVTVVMEERDEDGEAITSLPVGMFSVTVKVIVSVTVLLRARQALLVMVASSPSTGSVLGIEVVGFVKLTIDTVLVDVDVDVGSVLLSSSSSEILLNAMLTSSPAISSISPVFWTAALGKSLAADDNKLEERLGTVIKVSPSAATKPESDTPAIGSRLVDRTSSKSPEELAVPVRTKKYEMS